MSENKTGIIVTAKDQIAKARELSWDDIAKAIVGNGKIECVSTGAMIAGGGLAGYGVVSGDGEALVDGIVVGGIGASVRAANIGYRIYRAFRPATVKAKAPEVTELVKEPAITQAQAEEQLSLVDAAKTNDAQAEVLKKSAIELGLSADRWVQLSAKARENHLNKPECQLYNAIVKFAELQCQHV